MAYTQKSKNQPKKRRTESNENLIVQDIAHLIDAVETVEATVDALPASPTTTTVNISSAQILNMGTTPIELLPAPGVGKYYDVEKIIIEYNHVTTNYTSANLVIQGTGGNIYALLMPFDTQNTIAIINSQWENLEITEQYPIYYQTPLNQGLNITTMDNSNPTLGNGTLRVIITYTERTFGA